MTAYWQSKPDFGITLSSVFFIYWRPRTVPSFPTRGCDTFPGNHWASSLLWNEYSYTRKSKVCENMQMMKWIADKISGQDVLFSCFLSFWINIILYSMFPMLKLILLTKAHQSQYDSLKLCLYTLKITFFTSATNATTTVHIFPLFLWFEHVTLVSQNNLPSSALWQ